MTMHKTTDPLLASTARWMAAVRALESTRPDRLFDDPWASAMAGEQGLAWIASRSPDSVLPIVLRVRYFDDFLTRIAHQESISQIVLMAAGLDTRACRLDWPPGTSLYELDQPVVLQHKEGFFQNALVEPHCQRQAIPTDLTGDWQDDLIAAGFDPQAPSGWLLEGFLFYLPSERITSLLDEVNDLAAAGSYLGFDVINSPVLTSDWTRHWVEMQSGSGAPWIGVLDDPKGFLSDRGWQASLSQAGAPDANYGRWTLPIIPVDTPHLPHNWFVTAKKD